MKKRNIHLILTLFFTIGIAALTWLFYSNNIIVKSPLKIGSSYMTMNNEFYPVIDEQVANYVEQRNDFLYSRDPALSVNKQIEEIHSFINKKVNAILINPVNANSPKLNRAIDSAHKKGIKIIVVDSQVKTKHVDCTITSNNYQAGVLCAKALIKAKKRARILLLEHQTAASGVDRIRGFINTIKKNKNKNYQIIGHLQTYGQSEISYPHVKKFIEKNKHFDTIMALNDKAAVGALAAIDATHKHGKIAVYSVDGSEDMKKMIGVNSDAIASVAQSPITIGKKAIKIAYTLIAGEKVPKRIVLPVKIITVKNINQYNISGWQ